MSHPLLTAALFTLSLTALCACTPAAPPSSAPAAPSVAGTRAALIQRISNLPEGRVYEEIKDQFIERLHQGDYWSESEGTDTVEYLHIGGDGCWGCRLFMLVNQADLFVLINDWEGDPKPTEDYVLRYNSRENDLEAFCDAPKSILGKDDTGYSRPERAWFRLQEHRAGKNTTPKASGR